MTRRRIRREERHERALIAGAVAPVKVRLESERAPRALETPGETHKLRRALSTTVERKRLQILRNNDEFLEQTKKTRIDNESGRRLFDGFAVSGGIWPVLAYGDALDVAGEVVLGYECTVGLDCVSVDNSINTSKRYRLEAPASRHSGIFLRCPRK